MHAPHLLWFPHNEMNAEMNSITDAAKMQGRTHQTFLRVLKTFYRDTICMQDIPDYSSHKRECWTWGLGYIENYCGRPTQQPSLLPKVAPPHDFNPHRGLIQMEYIGWSTLRCIYCRLAPDFLCECNSNLMGKQPIEIVWVQSLCHLGTRFPPLPRHR